MARSTTLLLLTILLLTTLLPILNHHIHVLAVPVPIPVPIIPTTTTITDEPDLAVEHSNPSTIEKRQLLGGLLGGLPSFRNEGGNAIQGGSSEQPVTGGVVPGWNNANIGGR